MEKIEYLLIAIILMNAWAFYILGQAHDKTHAKLAKLAEAVDYYGTQHHR